MSVPNRAEHPNRKMGDHNTHLVDSVGFRDGMRPAGVNYSVHEHDMGTGAMKSNPTFSPSYETGSVDKTKEVLQGQVNMLSGKGQRYTIRGTVNYHPDEVKAAATRIANNNMKYDNRLNPNHPEYVHSGTDRHMIETQHHQNAVESLGGTHGVHNFMLHNFY